MKILRQLCAVTVLTIVLAQAALADGVIHPGIVSPTPTPAPSATGVIHPGFAEPGEEVKSEKTTVDLTIELALSLVKTMLALF